MKKKRRTFRTIGHTAPQPIQSMNRVFDEVVSHYNRAARKLTPLIRAQGMNVPEAVMLVCLYAYGTFSGHENDATFTMTEEEIQTALTFFLTFWQRGAIKPGSDFPFTLKQALAAFCDIDLGESHE